MNKEIVIAEPERMRMLAALEYTRGIILGADINNPYEDDMLNLTNTIMNSVDIKWIVNEK